MRSAHVGGAAAAAGWRLRIAAAAVLALAAAAAAAALLLTSGSAAAPRRRESLYFSAPSAGAAAIDRPVVDLDPTAAFSDAGSSAPFPPLPPHPPPPTPAVAAVAAVAPAPAPSESFDDVVEESSTARDVDAPPSLLQADSRAFVPSNVEPIASTSPIGDSVVGEVETRSIGKKVAPLQPEISTWLTPTDQELMYAKREIERAPPVLDDPDLYAPLFRNVSLFKRSYELMERILKVYIYRDGDRPIFHTPELKGIYASEGWFMKLLEGNKQFVVKDPSKAHLFYLPYSSRQLEYALYVPNSHTIIPLSIFLKNYVNMLAAKYPFWNRTKGADHFFVACHDWGPYTTKLHDELRKNTIKALCNADASEDVFVRGKDISLPETYIKTPKKPLRDVGGKPVSQRSIFAFFAGQMHGRVRPVLLNYWSGKDEDMRIYGPLPHRISRKMSYVQHMKSSKYCICPMGYEVNSPRIVEAIYYECVPVIIADNFVLPFEDVLNWSAFSVVVAERDIPRLKEILTGIPLRKYLAMQTNVKRLQRHFLWHAKPVKYDIFYMILHSIWLSRLNNMEVR